MRKETGESERRAVPYGEGVRQRRRPRWAEFREAYPRIVTAMALGLVALIALDAWVLYKRVSFRRETARLRSSMSEVEKKRADTIVAAAEGRVALQVELVRRRALGDPSLNLAVAVDEGKMFLQREGARLREMRVRVGPEATIGDPPDAIRLAPPRGQRAVLRAVGPTYRWEVPPGSTRSAVCPCPLSARSRARWGRRPSSSMAAPSSTRGRARVPWPTTPT